MISLFRKRSVSLARFILFLFPLCWALFSLIPPPAIKENHPPLLYSSECADRLFSVFTHAINQAEKEIYFMIYALTDRKVIAALNHAVSRGVAITIVHDPKTETKEFADLSEQMKKVAAAGHALMHRKILVIDGKKVLIGSANGTAASLRLHHNLVVGLQSARLSQQITQGITPSSLEIGGQYMEFYTFPEHRAVGLPRLLSLIEESKESLVVGMFTWTYAPLTEAIIEAHRRGVKVNVIVDQQSAHGTSHKVVDALVKAGISVRLGPRDRLFHHKFLYVDEKILATGSTNWTKAAFYRNQDCLIILHDLTKRQRKKMRQMCKIIRCTTQLT